MVITYSLQGFCSFHLQKLEKTKINQSMVFSMVWLIEKMVRKWKNKRNSRNVMKWKGPKKHFPPTWSSSFLKVFLWRELWWRWHFTMELPIHKMSHSLYLTRLFSLVIRWNNLELLLWGTLYIRPEGEKVTSRWSRHRTVWCRETTS